MNCDKIKDKRGHPYVLRIYDIGFKRDVYNGVEKLYTYIEYIKDEQFDKAFVMWANGK